MASFAAISLLPRPLASICKISLSRGVSGSASSSSSRERAGKANPLAWTCAETCVGCSTSKPFAAACKAAASWSGAMSLGKTARTPARSAVEKAASDAGSTRSTTLKSDARPDAIKESRSRSKGSPVESTRIASRGSSSRRPSRSSRLAKLPATSMWRDASRISKPERSSGEAATMKTEITPRRSSLPAADFQVAR